MEQHSSLILEYMGTLNYTIDQRPGHLNIIYLEGINPDFTPNPDAPDGWNDLRLIISHDISRQPKIIFSATCTTEPGKAATMATAAAKIGGVARIAFGQYKAWRMGFHQRAKWGEMHPALVQCAPIPVHRDKNKDFVRTNDPIDWGRGINQHGTRPNYRGGEIGNHSAGCLVGQWWPEHIRFIEICRLDPQYMRDKRHIFTSTIIAGNKYLQFVASKT